MTVVIDTGATQHVFGNTTLLKDVELLEQPMRLRLASTKFFLQADRVGTLTLGANVMILTASAPIHPLPLLTDSARLPKAAVLPRSLPTLVFFTHAPSLPWLVSVDRSIPSGEVTTIVLICTLLLKPCYCLSSPRHPLPANMVT